MEIKHKVLERNSTCMDRKASYCQDYLKCFKESKLEMKENFL